MMRLGCKPTRDRVPVTDVNGSSGIHLVSATSCSTAAAHAAEPGIGAQKPRVQNLHAATKVRGIAALRWGEGLGSNQFAALFLAMRPSSHSMLCCLALRSGPQDTQKRWQLQLRVCTCLVCTCKCCEFGAQQHGCILQWRLYVRDDLRRARVVSGVAALREGVVERLRGLAREVPAAAAGRAAAIPFIWALKSGMCCAKGAMSENRKLRSRICGRRAAGKAAVNTRLKADSILAVAYTHRTSVLAVERAR